MLPIHPLSDSLKQVEAGWVKTIGTPAGQVFHGFSNLTHQLEEFNIINSAPLLIWVNQFKVMKK